MEFFLFVDAIFSQLALSKQYSILTVCPRRRQHRCPSSSMDFLCTVEIVFIERCASCGRRRVATKQVVYMVHGTWWRQAQVLNMLRNEEQDDGGVDRLRQVVKELEVRRTRQTDPDEDRQTRDRMGQERGNYSA